MQILLETFEDERIMLEMSKCHAVRKILKGDLSSVTLVLEKNKGYLLLQ